jgi:hypothetical protein
MAFFTIAVSSLIVGLLNKTIGAAVFCPGILLIPQAPF